MKLCNDCIHAKWDRTPKGRLHPKGYGECTFVPKVPVLPQAFWWQGLDTPKPFGGGIQRNRELADHCAYWSNAPALRVSIATKATGLSGSPARGEE